MTRGYGEFGDFEDFGEFFEAATGHRPYAYQRGWAEGGLPTEARVPSGGGKTAGAVLAWLYRRSVSAAEATARRLVYVLPQGSLADGTHARIAGWLERLGCADEVDLHLLTGPDAQNGTWRRAPERSAILVGTHDALLSRALLRGFADARPMAPVSFALLNNDAHWVFDEMHLLGPGLPTSVRLQALRGSLGTTAPTSSTWMSSVGGADVPSTACSGAVRRIGRLHPDPGRYVQDLAGALLAAHVPGTQTLAVLGSVRRARELDAALRAARPGQEVLLVHPYARSAERRERAREAEERGRDRILVATRALDAGPDVSARTVLAELAPWAAFVQRAGRCNRWGEHPGGGDLLWCVPPDDDPDADPDPDPDTDADAAAGVARWLEQHEGAAVTTGDLFRARVVPEAPPAQVPPLDARTVAALFDNARGAAPVEVDRWVCADAERTVFVAWREWGPDGPSAGGPAEDEPDPGRGEQCEAPLPEVAELLDGGGQLAGVAWLRDPVDGGWRRAAAGDLRAGSLLLVDSARGGHLPGAGWSPGSGAPVASLSAGRRAAEFACVAWVSLDRHLRETEEEARAVLAALPGLTGGQREAVALAARFHDLGKCHEVFQAKLRGGGGDPPAHLLAKSKAPFSTGVSARPYFRHELVSALVLLGGGHWHVPGVDPALVTYLAAAHHGQVRVSVRPGAGEERSTLLGVREGDRTPPVEVSSGECFPAQSLDPGVFRPGGAWTREVESLRDRAELGPFRLAHLESLVRVADWRASARHDGPTAGLVP